MTKQIERSWGPEMCTLAPDVNGCGLLARRRGSCWVWMGPTGMEVGVVLERQRCFDSGCWVPELWVQVWLPTLLGWVYQSAPYWSKQKAKCSHGKYPGTFTQVLCFWTRTEAAVLYLRVSILKQRVMWEGSPSSTEHCSISQLIASAELIKLWLAGEHGDHLAVHALK